MGAHLVAEGANTPLMTRVAVSDPKITHSHSAPVLSASAAPAVQQSQPVPNPAPVRHHPRRHRPAPKPRQAAHRKRAGKPHSAQTLAPQPPRMPALMLLDHAVLDMQAAGASRTVLDYINQPQNLVSTPQARNKPLVNATRVQVFNSYAAIAQALADHHIAADTRAVLYDNEHSTGTPENELQNPVQYCQMTAGLLHEYGLEYIASPGFDLSGPRPKNGQWFQQFVRTGLMNCARYADYLDVQDQLMQGTATYAQDARTAAKLLHQINPKAKLLMGLSSSPSGRLDTADQLWRAYQDTNQ